MKDDTRNLLIAAAVVGGGYFWWKSRQKTAAPNPTQTYLAGDFGEPQGGGEGDPVAQAVRHLCMFPKNLSGPDATTLTEEVVRPIYLEERAKYPGDQLLIAQIEALIQTVANRVAAMCPKPHRPGLLDMARRLADGVYQVESGFHG